MPASSGERLRNGTVSVRPYVCPVERQPVSSSDVQLVCRSSSAGDKYRSIAAGAAYRLQIDIERRAGSVDVVTRGGSTQTCLNRRD